MNAEEWDRCTDPDAMLKCLWSGYSPRLLRLFISDAGDETAQADLLRCIFRNPYRPAPAIHPAVLKWNGGAIVKLASAIHAGQSFEDMALLADALEEAGCTDPRILAHCRGQGPHAGGCFVLYLLRPATNR